MGAGQHRFGRVLHWVGTALSIPVVMGTAFYLGFWVYVQTVPDQGHYMSPDTYLVIALGGLTMSLLIYFGGRALRYIFSGE